MDEADEAPVREPSARGRSRKPTKAQAALEKLRAAREKRESRAEQYEVESDDELFDVVPEEEYQALVRKRQAEDDFVVDDDGMGYVDNGEEYLDRMSDEEEAGAEAKGAKRSRAATAADEAMKKARKLNKLGALGGTGVQSASILKYMQTTGKAVGPGMAATARPKAAAEASLNLDDLLEDLASDPLGRAAGSGAPRRRSMGDVRPARGARLAFDSPPPVGGARRAAAASAPQQRRRAAKPEPQEYAAADDFDGGGGGYDYEGGSGGDKDFAAGAADDGAAAAGDAAGQ